jgi:hypothetical protein
MKELVLTGFAYSPHGAFGSMLVDGVMLYTVEDAWNDNKVGVSCIPEGVYTCRPRPFYRGGYDAIEITNVPGRSHILFHIGNTSSDLRGCIAPGMGLGFLNGLWAVVSSRKAFSLLMEHFGGEEFKLVITNACSSGTYGKANV